MGQVVVGGATGATDTGGTSVTAVWGLCVTGSVVVESSNGGVDLPRKLGDRGALGPNTLSVSGA